MIHLPEKDEKTSNDNISIYINDNISIYKVTVATVTYCTYRLSYTLNLPVGGYNEVFEWLPSLFPALIVII